MGQLARLVASPARTWSALLPCLVLLPPARRVPPSRTLPSRRHLSTSSARDEDLIPAASLDSAALKSPNGQASARRHLKSILASTGELKDQWTKAKSAGVTWSRSGGKGGQNVNKVSTKASLRVELEKLSSHLPKYLFANLLRSRYYAATTHTLFIQSSTTRSAALNADECWSKLFDAIRLAGEDGLVGETSPEQKKKVEALERAAKARRRVENERRGDKKSSRAKVSL